MKKLMIILFIAIGPNIAKAQPSAPVEKQWVPVSELTDEFNSSLLDGSKWINYHPYWDGRPPSAFKKENVSVSGGCLKLKSTVANYQQQGIWVNAACVSSKTKAMKPGYYSEARIKCPTLSMTGAYWFQGSYSEIDVIENFGAPTAPAYSGYETHMMTNLHYFKDGWANDKATPWEAAIIKPACNKDFFTYGVWWKDSATVIFYLDGKAVHTSKPGGFFKENMYMFFDMETFTWGVGLPTIESLDDSTKNVQYVDWVRTYKLEDLKTGLNLHKSSDENRVNIFPNPVTDSSLNVQVEGETSDFTVKISDLNGKVFFEKISTEKLININRNIFSSKGIFLINVYSDDFNHVGKLFCN